MNRDNPCNICTSSDNCEGCIFERRAWRNKGECYNDKCMCNYECGCLLSLDDECKASTCFDYEQYVGDVEE